MPALLAEQDGHVLTVTINRPEKKNAVNAPNPEVPGMPTTLREATANAAMVHGMRLASPDIWLILVLCVDT